MSGRVRRATPGSHCPVLAWQRWMWTPRFFDMVTQEVAAMKVFAAQAPGVMTRVKNRNGKTALELAVEVTSGASDQVPRMIEDLVRDPISRQLS